MWIWGCLRFSEFRKDIKNVKRETENLKSSFCRAEILHNFFLFLLKVFLLIVDLKCIEV